MRELAAAGVLQGCGQNAEFDLWTVIQLKAKHQIVGAQPNSCSGTVENLMHNIDHKSRK